MSARGRGRRLVPLVVLALVLAPARARAGACVYIPLSSDVTSTASASPTLYQFMQANVFWSAVAVRPVSGEDWDLTAFGATAPDPTCVAAPLASSTGGVGVLDFVIGDFNHNPVGTYYVSASRFSGAAAGEVQWDDGADQVTVNGTSVTQTMASSDLIRVYDVNLVSGATYRFDFYPQSGGSAHLLLFRNAGGGTYWVGRSAAQFDVTGPTSFVAPSSGFYGLVVTSDAGTPFSYSLGVTSSACPIPTTLSAGASVSIGPPSGIFAIDEHSNAWLGLGVRPASGDWDAQLYGLPSGGSYPTCLAGELANSALGGTQVDVVVGDFNHSPLGWYFVNANLFGGAAGCQVQNTGTHGTLVVNNDPVQGTLAATDVAQVRDVFLDAGHTYAFTFSPFIAGMSMLVFANTGGGAYYAGRSSAVVSSTSSATYTAPVTGWYGVLVANDGAVAGSYVLGVGDCSLVTPLANDIVAGTGSSPNAYFSFRQADHFWAAIALRNTSLDWDLTVNQDSVTAPAPACATLPLAGSTGVLPLQDFVVGDFNVNAIGTYYVHAHQYTTAPIDPASVEWDSGTDQIRPNDNNLAVRSTGPSDVIGCWDVFLFAGQKYEFDLSHAGVSDLHLLLFRNAGGGTYWAGRASAQFTTGTTQLYIAPASGYYAVAVVNDNGVPDTYSIAVKTCDPIVAVAAEPGLNLASTGVFLGSFTQSQPYWTAAAVRSNAPPEDWDLIATSLPSGGPPGYCLDGNLAGSAQPPGRTDYVIGDFNYVPTGTYYVRANRFFGTGDAALQYSSLPPATLSLNAPHTVKTKLVSFLVQCWDVLLTSGNTYSVFFSHDPGFDAHVGVFAPTGVAFWGNRADALVESNHTVSFVAPSSGFFGIVVVSDGGSGTFNLAVNDGFTAVDEAPPPSRDALASISPNPGRGGLRLDFALHEGGSVAFDVLDMAGRRVSRFEPGVKPAGEWSEAWPATDATGRRLHPGLYFIRMRIGDRLVGTRKVTLLE